MNGPKKLYRVDKGGMLAGVCGGLAEYFNIDVTIIRLVWAAVGIGSIGFGIVLYIAAAIILPRKSDVYPGY